MRQRRITQSAIGAVALLAWSLLGTVPASLAKTVEFISTDEPGPWFKCVTPLIDAVQGGCVPESLALSKSVALIQPGDSVKLINNTLPPTNINGVDTTNTVHTFTSLLWPAGAANMPHDQYSAFKTTDEVQLTTEGLYVFVCKLHPFMLAATVVDANGLGDGRLELGNAVTLISYGQTVTVPTSSDLATRLLRTFFLITNPANYQDHNPATNPSLKWHIAYPPLPVKTDLAPVLDLKAVLEARYGNDLPIAGPAKPSIAGIGEIWVDAEYEKTQHKTKPGTAIAVNASTWEVTKRVALPGINMNNPHNMWSNRDQTRIYQTQWFSDKLTVFNRITGRMIRNITVGDSPAHVMTRVDTDQVHTSLNGEGSVVEYNPNLSFSREIFTQNPGERPAQPHAHWMSFDGKTMVTPNSNTNDSTRIDLIPGTIAAKTDVGTLPIATGMMPDASKYYVSNYLDSTITCISIGKPACKDGANKVAKKDIVLLLSGTANPLANYDHINVTAKGMSESGALPIQTPVSPDGRFVITANTLSGTISIIDTKTDTLVRILPCSAGCHGVNFGAKNGGGYYAYVSSKFSNDLIIVDYDPNRNGNVSDAKIAGRVILVGGAHTRISDDPVDPNFKGLAGMGGQGVLPVPNVYNGWVQKLPSAWKYQLTEAQRNPFPNDDHDDDHR
ncbi:MAG: copper oxidase [Nitrospiraceae bacterium]|nr:copper oxidase [Nitrospiraceae bacterium]